MLDYLIVFIISKTLIKDNLRRGYKFSVILGILMIVNVLIYVVLVELLKDSWVGSQRVDFVRTMKYVLLALAIGEFFLIAALRKLMFRAMHKRGPSRQQIIEGLLTIDLITFALCEAIVLYGLILFFLSSDSRNFYVFVVLGLIACGIYFPRYSKWEDWGKLEEAKNMSTT
jgi:hypothetical protein